MKKEEQRDIMKCWGFVFLVMAFLLPILVGCGTFKKELHEKKQVEAIEVTEVVDSVKTNFSERTELAKSDHTTTTDKGVTITTETRYSKPDSVGIQHKVAEIRTEKRNDVVVANDKSEKLLQEKDLQISELRTKNVKLKAKINTESELRKKVKNTTPFWLYVLIFIGGAFVGLYVTKQFEKYGVVSRIKKILRWGKGKLSKEDLE